MICLFEAFVNTLCYPVMMGHRPQLLVIWITLLFSYSYCFYVPGWSSHVHRIGDLVPLWLNKVSSERTHLPYAYSELPGVCKPTKDQIVSLNLGEILRGAYEEFSF